MLEIRPRTDEAEPETQRDGVWQDGDDVSIDAAAGLLALRLCRGRTEIDYRLRSRILAPVGWDQATATFGRVSCARRLPLAVVEGYLRQLLIPLDDPPSLAALLDVRPCN